MNRSRVPNIIEQSPASFVALLANAVSQTPARSWLELAARFEGRADHFEPVPQTVPSTGLTATE